MSDPKAPEVHGWKPQQYGGFARGNWDADFDGEDLEASVNVSGYGGYGDRMCLPLPVLRALLSAHGLAIVTEADRKVLEDIRAISEAWHVGKFSDRHFEAHKAMRAIGEAIHNWRNDLAEAELEARKTREK